MIYIVLTVVWLVTGTPEKYNKGKPPTIRPIIPMKVLKTAAIKNIKHKIVLTPIVSTFFVYYCSKL